MRDRLAAVLYVAIALALAVFTGSAFAGDGNGNGNGNGGNSATAPGQVNQQTAPPAATPAPAPPQHQPAAPKPAASKPGVSKPAASKPAAAKPAAKPTNATKSPVQSATKGVKPSSTTHKDTHTTVGASPDVSKRYGNGNTAAEIAKANGAPDSADLHGPGNSQPHKIQVCPGGREVDVHAYKGDAHCATAHAAPAHDHAHAAEKKVEHASKPAKTEKTDNATAAHEQKPNCPQSVVFLKTSTSTTTAQSSAPASLLTGGSNATGVKPSNTTQHGVWAATSSDKTKLYGNGTTAGALAELLGYSGALFGPGNSQPHKANCGDHLVDVHALASHLSQCAAATTEVQVATSSCGETVVTTMAPPTAGAAAQVLGAQATQQTAAPPAGTALAAPTQQQQPPQQQQQQPSGSVSAGGVKGVTATLQPAKKPKAKKQAGGVLGKTAAIGKVVMTKELPFTGLPLWIFVAVASALVASGYVVRRAATAEERT